MLYFTYYTVTYNKHKDSELGPMWLWLHLLGQTVFAIILLSHDPLHKSPIDTSACAAWTLTCNPGQLSFNPIHTSKCVNYISETTEEKSYLGFDGYNKIGMIVINMNPHCYSEKRTQEQKKIHTNPDRQNQQLMKQVQLQLENCWWSKCEVCEKNQPHQTQGCHCYASSSQVVELNTMEWEKKRTPIQFTCSLFVWGRSIQ